MGNYPANKITLSQRCGNVVVMLYKRCNITLATRISVDSQGRCYNVVFDVVPQHKYSVVGNYVATLHAHSESSEFRQPLP